MSSNPDLQQPDLKAPPLTVLRFPFLTLAVTLFYGGVTASTTMAIVDRYYAGVTHLYNQVGWYLFPAALAFAAVGLACSVTLRSQGEAPASVPAWQRLNWGLITCAFLLYATHVSFIYFDLGPSARGVLPPVNEWTTFRSSDHRVTVSAPTRWKSWRHSNYQDSLIYIQDAAAGAGLIVKAEGRELPTEQVGDLYMEPEDLRFLYTIVHVEETEFAGRPAIARVYDGGDAKQLCYYVQCDDRVVSFAFVTHQRLFDAYQPMFKEIMRSVEFSEQ